MGSKTQTSTSQSSTTPANLSGLQSIFNQVQNVSQNPYVAYTGEMTAPVNAQQQLGINNINSSANTAQPYYGTAANYATQAGAPIDQSQINSYLNPYTQSVINATQANFDESNGQQQQQVKGNAALAGALGGDRQAVAQAETARQQQLAQAPVIAGLNQANYTQALQAAQADRSAAGNAAGIYGNLGTAAQSAALQGANAQVGAGTLQQQTQQAQDTAAYQQYLQAQGFPYQQAQFYAQYGLPAAIAQGSSSTGSQTTPGPNPFVQAAGLGLSAASLFSDERVKEGKKIIGKTFDGQPIYKFRYKGSPTVHIGLMAQKVEKAHPDAVGEDRGIKTVNYDTATRDAAKRGHFASGGSVSLPFGGVGYIPIGNGIPSGQLNASPLPQMHTNTQANDLSPITKGLSGFSGSLGGESYGGGNIFTDAYGGSSSHPLEGLDASDYGPGFRVGGLVKAITNIHKAIGGSVDAGSPFRMYADGGDVPASFDDRFSAAFPMQSPPVVPAPSEDAPVVNPDEPFRLPSEGATQAWRDSVDNTAPLIADNTAAPNPMTTAAQPDLPPQITAPDGQPDQQPSDALGFASAPPVSPFATVAAPVSQPSAPTNSMGGFNPFNLSDKTRQALMVAGLGIAASKSPFALSAIGEGGLQGTKAYSDMTAAEQAAVDKRIAQEQNQTRINQEAQRIANQAGQFATTSAETARHNKASEEKPPSFGIIGDNPDTGAHIYGWRDPSTGKVTDSNGNPINPSTFSPKSPALDKDGKPITGDDYLATLSPARATLAKQIADYKVNPAGLSIRGGHREQAIADATRYNPDYDQRIFTASNRAMTNFLGGQEGRTIRSLNVAIDHLSTLDEAAAAMKNGDYPTLNRIVNAYRQQTGSPLATNFDSIRQVVSAEVAKSVVGGQTALHDRDDLAQRASNASSPAQLSGIITEFKKLMAGQMKGLRKQYEVTTRAKNFDDFLEPQTKAELGKLSGVKDNYSPSAELGNSTTTKVVNGKTYVRRGTDWFAQ